MVHMMNIIINKNTVNKYFILIVLIFITLQFTNINKLYYYVTNNFNFTNQI